MTNKTAAVENIVLEVLVVFPDDQFVDEMGGVDFKDAMKNARNNWVDAKIVYLDDVTNKFA